MTSIFIYIIFGVIIGYDIWVAVTRRQTITGVFRKWYQEKPMVPFMVGVVFIGHFQTLVEVYNIPLFIILSIIYVGWSIVMQESNIPYSRKFYNLNQKIFLIPMTLGTIVGSFWRS